MTVGLIGRRSGPPPATLILAVFVAEAAAAAAVAESNFTFGCGRWMVLSLGAAPRSTLAFL